MRDLRYKTSSRYRISLTSDCRYLLVADEKRLGLDGCPHCGKRSLALGAVKQVPYGARGAFLASL